MKFPREMYDEFHHYRDRFGKKEYDRDDLLPGVMDIISRHCPDEEGWKRELAIKLIDDAEKSEKKRHTNQGDLFSYESHVALGDKMRIKRGYMNLQQHWRRKFVIDQNKKAQDGAWSDETGWLNDGIQALFPHDQKKKRIEVLAEDGSPVIGNEAA